jgi:SAM-dependent methyltransferase
VSSNGKFEPARYWRTVGSSYAKDDPLGAICFDGAPSWFNQFLSHSHTACFERGWKAAGLTGDGMRVVDLGCGVGRWSRWLRKQGADVVGVDISRDMLRAAESAKSRRVQGSISDVPLQPETFDMAVSVTVLQHIPYADQERAVAEMSRLLRTGGTAFLIENVRAFAPGAHLYPRTLEAWTKLLEREGLKVRIVQGQAYYPLIRLGYKLASLLPSGRRKNSAADRMKQGTNGQRPSVTASWLGRAAAPLMLLARLGVLASYPLEHFSMAFLGPNYATNVLLIAEKQPVPSSLMAYRVKRQLAETAR